VASVVFEASSRAWSKNEVESVRASPKVPAATASWSARNWPKTRPRRALASLSASSPRLLELLVLRPVPGGERARGEENDEHGEQLLHAALHRCPAGGDPGPSG
jgi:hypothetical protein